MMFNKRSLSVVCLCLLASPVDSGRVKTTQEQLEADTSQPTAKLTTGNAEELQRFIAENELKSCNGACKGMLIGNIVEGLLARNLVEDIKWEAPTLSVTLNIDHAYGQIATKSKVPVAWVVDKEFVAEVVKADSTTTLKMVGLHTEVTAQGIQVYKEVMEAQIVGSSSSWGTKTPVLYSGDGTMMDRASEYGSICATPSDACSEYLEYERKAAAYWLQFNAKEFITGSKKLAKIVNAAKPTSKLSPITWDNWGSILFSMASSAGKNIDELIFDNEKDGGVIAKASLWSGSQSYHDIVQYNLLEKAQLIGGKALTNCPSSLSGVVASKAKSGWGFGMLFAHGDPVVATQVKKYPQAQPAKLVDLFSLCEKGEVDADPACSGSDHGRLHWTDTLPQDYL